MGLDMYLMVERSEIATDYFTLGDLTQEYPKELHYFSSYHGRTVERDTRYEVGYWRKAYAIHNWIVNHCAAGVENCTKIELDIEHIKQLLDICEQVRKDINKAPKLLPTITHCSYGDNYKEDLLNTIKILEPVYEFLKNNTDELYKVVYQASW